MFLTHTPIPAKPHTDKSPTNSPKVSANDKEEAGPSSTITITKNTNVRRSIGEWESVTGIDHKAGTSRTQPNSPTKEVQVPMAPTKQKKKEAVLPTKTPTPLTSVEVVNESPISDTPRPTNKLRQCRTWLEKAKFYVNESRNLKTDLKTGIFEAVENMYRLMREQTSELVKANKNGTKSNKDEKDDKENKERDMEIGQDLITMMREQGEKIDKTQRDMEKLKETIALQTALQQNNTYAEVTAAQPRKYVPERSALHSIVITSKNDSHTGDEVMNEVRQAVNAKDGWVTVERVRKVKDRKVLIGCRTEEEREKIKERLKSADDRLTVEDMKNQDPMVVLKDVLAFNSNDDVLVALRNQNKGVFLGLEEKDDRADVKFRRRARNPLTCHIALRVSPQLYNRMMNKGAMHIDMQKVKVAEQSPLVQCSMCLAYGHGRRFCKDTLPKCSHCGGPHMKAECEDFLTSAAPTCCNCMAAKVENAEHNAFSSVCPVRRRWEALAKAKVAYC